jgi:hypothetical protein
MIPLHESLRVWIQRSSEKPFSDGPGLPRKRQRIELSPSTGRHSAGHMRRTNHPDPWCQ